MDLGASQLQVLRYVLLPHLMPALAAGFILAFSWSFNNFEISYFGERLQPALPAVGLLDPAPRHQSARGQCYRHTRLGGRGSARLPRLAVLHVALRGADRSEKADALLEVVR